MKAGLWLPTITLYCGACMIESCNTAFSPQGIDESKELVRDAKEADVS